MSERTYETRLSDALIADGPGAGRPAAELFDEMAVLLARVEHRLYVEHYVQKRPLANCKHEFIAKYGITARQFNALRISLGAKAAAALESMKTELAKLDERIRSAEKWIKKKEKRIATLTKQIQAETERIHPGPRPRRPVDGPKLASLVAERKQLRANLHHKRRYLASLEHQKACIDADLAAKSVRFCFGGRKRFRAQFNLTTNGYASHEEWRENWQAARASQVYLVGSKDETGGNQSCAVIHAPDGTRLLRIRVPGPLESSFGRWVMIPLPDFPYGQQELEAALAREDGITWRFIRRPRGWHLQVMVEALPAPVVSIPECGAIGVDLNADHLATCELDRFGNPLARTARRMPLLLYKRSHAQIQAALGDVVAAVVVEAKEAHKPIVVERLDFQAKRARLRESGGTAMRGCSLASPTERSSICSPRDANARVSSS